MDDDFLGKINLDIEAILRYSYLTSTGGLKSVEEDGVKKYVLTMK